MYLFTQRMWRLFFPIPTPSGPSMIICFPVPCEYPLIIGNLGSNKYLNEALAFAG